MLTKGRHVMVEGRLKLNSWETDEGVKRSKLTVVAESVNLTPSNPNPQRSAEQSAPVPVSVGASSETDDTPF